MENAVGELAAHIRVSAIASSQATVRAKNSVAASVSRAGKIAFRSVTDRATGGINRSFRKLNSEVLGEIDRLARVVSMDTWESVIKQGIQDSGVPCKPRRPSHKKYLDMFGLKRKTPILQGIESMRVKELESLHAFEANLERIGSEAGWKKSRLRREKKVRMSRYAKKFGRSGPSGLSFIGFSQGNKTSWKASNYINMLIRTTATNVYRVAYADATKELGKCVAKETGNEDDENAFDLAQIVGGACPCPVCDAWRGVIVSLNGLFEGFPTVEDAEEEGVWHPNCVCNPLTVNVFSSAGRRKIETQRGLPIPPSPVKGDWTHYAREVQRKARPQVPIGSKSQAQKNDPLDRSRKAQATKRRKAGV